MTSNAQNVYAAEPLITGSCLVAPLGTVGPTDANTELDAAFIDLGHVGEDGFTETQDRTVDKKKNFGGSTVKLLQTEYVHSFKFILLESLNADVLKAVYGESNVQVTAGTALTGTQVHIKKNKTKLPKQCWVFDTTDTELNAFYRNHVPQGQIMTIGDVKIVHTDTIAYEVELEAFEDADGTYVHTYTDDGQLVSNGGQQDFNWTAVVTGTGTYHYTVDGTQTGPLTESSTTAEIHDALNQAGTTAGFNVTGTPTSYTILEGEETGAAAVLTVDNTAMVTLTGPTSTPTRKGRAA